MKSNSLLITVAAFIALMSLSSSFAQGGPPSGGDMASAAGKRQAQLFKTRYGFSNAQVTRYQASEAKIYSDWQKSLALMQKQMGTTKDSQQKRALMVKMRDSIKTRDVKVQQALRAVATPTQRAKM